MAVLQATPERLNAMHQEVEQLQHLVTDLRTLSLADAGELNLNLRPLNINQPFAKDSHLLPTSGRATTDSY